MTVWTVQNDRPGNAQTKRGGDTTVLILDDLRIFCRFKVRDERGAAPLQRSSKRTIDENRNGKARTASSENSFDLPD
ncbi:MAG: hypothetical protein KF688_07645 [Pirellulales bacterium]|nr:hypothetical protein [Pirellulales bacterium]